MKKKIFLSCQRRLASNVFIKVCFILCVWMPAYAGMTVTVITGNDYAPYTDEKLPEGGVYTSLVKKILARMNYKYTIKFLPWARGYEMVKKGKAELTFPYIKTEEREKEVLYARTYLMQTNLYLITNLKPQNANKKSLSDFKNNIFCNPIGYAFEPVIKELIDKKGIQIQIVTEFDELTCLKTVIAGKADFMTVNAEYLRQLKKDDPTITEFRKIMPEVSHNYLHVIFPKTVDPKFMEEFNKQTEEFMATEEYKNIVKEYE